MTTPFPFTSGQVLTAAQMNAITELVVNDKTASHTLTAADAGDRVIMNSASATTITVNTSIFTAGQVIYVTNKGAGVCTITAGTATVSTTGTLALAQFASGVLYCISAGVFLFEGYDKAATAAGLAFLSAGTFTTATSASLPTNTFTSTHRNYRVIYNITAQTASCAISMRLRAAGSDNTTSNYFAATAGFTSANGASDQGEASQSAFNFGTTFASTAIPSVYTFDVFNPQIAASTFLQGVYSFFNTSGNLVGRSGGYNFDPTTAFDSLTLISSVATSITGVFRVYGYADS